MVTSHGHKSLSQVIVTAISTFLVIGTRTGTGIGTGTSTGTGARTGHGHGHGHFHRHVSIYNVNTYPHLRTQLQSWS